MYCKVDSKQILTVVIHHGFWITDSDLRTLLCFLENHLRASEATQQVEVLAAKPEDLSLISGTNMVKEENRLLQVVL